MVKTFEDHCWQDVIDQETLEIYEPYQREVNIGRKPALLVIDLYNMAYEGGAQHVHELVKKFPSSCGINAWSALQPTLELISIARSNGMSIIYTTRSGNRINSTHRQKQLINEHSYTIKEEFKPQSQDIIIYKERASGFFGTTLIVHLTQLNVDTLIVCGQSTSGCVRASVVDAYSYGFHPVIAEECCFDRSNLSHKINLFDLHHKYADVMKLNEIKEHLAMKS